MMISIWWIVVAFVSGAVYGKVVLNMPPVDEVPKDFKYNPGTGAR